MSVFDRQAEEFAFWKWTTSPQRYAEVLDFVQKDAARAIDVGCGAGQLVMRLTERIPYVVGLDPSHSMIKIAKRYHRERGRDDVDFVMGKIETLPFPQHSFDFVTCYHILHFVPVEQALIWLRELLKPGGRLVVSEIWHPEASRVSFTDQASRALRLAPKQVRLYGFRKTWRILRFQTSPEWINQIRQYSFLNSEEFQTICSRLYPGCKFVRFRNETAALWQAPLKEH